MSARVFVIFALLSLSLSLESCGAAPAESSGDEQKSAPELAVDIVSSHGNQIRIPYGSEELKNIPPEIRQRQALDFVEMIDKLESGLVRLIRNNAKGGIFAGASRYYMYVELGGSLAKLALSQRSRFQKLAKQVGYVENCDEYKQSFGDRIANMFELSAQRAQQLKGSERDPEKLIGDLQLLFSNLKEAVAVSQSATYLDWFGGSIDGVKLGDIFGRLAGDMRHNQFDRLINILKRVTALMLSTEKDPEKLHKLSAESAADSQ